MELSAAAKGESTLEEVDNSVKIKRHELNNKWVFWAHLPHDINWTIESYIKLVELSTIEDTLTLNKTIPDKMIKNCMLFLMKKELTLHGKMMKTRMVVVFHLRFRIN